MSEHKLVTLAELDELKAFRVGATPGPWFTESFKDDNGEHRWTTIHDGKTGYGDDIIADTNLGICTTDADKPEEKENATYISHVNPAFVERLENTLRQAIEVIEDQRQFLTWLGYDALLIGNDYKIVSRSKRVDVDKFLASINSAADSSGDV